MHAGNTTGAGITFISVSQPTASPAGVISFIGINVDTSVPGNINFFGASVVPAAPAVVFYQVG